MQPHPRECLLSCQRQQTLHCNWSRKWNQIRVELCQDVGHRHWRSAAKTLEPTKYSSKVTAVKVTEGVAIGASPVAAAPAGMPAVVPAPTDSATVTGVLLEVGPNPSRTPLMLAMDTGERETTMALASFRWDKYQVDLVKLAPFACQQRIRELLQHVSGKPSA